MSQSTGSSFFVPKMTKRQVAIVVPIVAVVAAIVATQLGLVPSPFARDLQANQPEQGPIALPVNVTRVFQVNEFEQQRTFTGTVRARNRSELAFEIGGKIKSINVDEGDRIEKGDMIAVLDTHTLQAQKNAMAASLTQAKSFLAELESGPRQQQIDSAQARVQALQSELNRAKMNLERRQRLWESKAISTEEFDQANFTKTTAQANLDSAKEELAELLAGTRQEKIDAQKAVVKQLDASMAEIDVMISKSELVAPFSGTVTRRYLDPGTIAQPSAPVIRLVEQQHLEAWVGFPVDLVSDMKIGDSYQAIVNGGKFEVTVSAKIPELDPATRTQMVILDFEQGAGSRVVSGQLCEVSILTLVEGSGFWLPTTALSKGVRGLWTVLAVVPGNDGVEYRTERRDVEIIKTSDENVLARGTINEDDLIVVDRNSPHHPWTERTAERPGELNSR